MRAAVDQFKAWFATAPMLKYSGRVSNANKLARIQPVVAMFCRENEEVVRQLGCAPGRGYARPMAGQKGADFKRIRDVMITGLSELEREMGATDATALFAQRGKVRAIAGWEPITRVHLLPHEVPLPADDERCKINDFEYDCLQPPYETEAVAQGARPKSRKRKRDWKHAAPGECGTILAYFMP